MKINILTGSNSRNSGGLFNSVKSLVLKLNDLKKIDCKVLSYNDEDSQKDLATWGEIEMATYNIFGPKNFAFSPNLAKILRQKKPDIIHQQGVWYYPSRVAYNYKQKHNTSNIISPRGMLDSWALNNSKLKKKIVGHWYEYKNLQNADCIHALCESEYLAIRNFGLKNPVAVIPNGVNLPMSFKREFSDKRKKTLLFIGRIHPKKGLTLLIKALGILKPKGFFDNWNVRIAGWDQNEHRKKLETLVLKLGLKDFVSFLGPVYGEQKRLELINADAFILPSHSEGLPMSILEAWSYKLPVVMTKACNLPEGFNNNAAIKIERDEIDISEKLEALNRMSCRQLSNMSSNGFLLVKDKFQWAKIAEEMAKVYTWLLANDKMPETIRVD